MIMISVISSNELQAERQALAGCVLRLNRWLVDQGEEERVSLEKWEYLDSEMGGGPQAGGVQPGGTGLRRGGGVVLAEVRALHGAGVERSAGGNPGKAAREAAGGVVQGRGGRGNVGGAGGVPGTSGSGMAGPGEAVLVDGRVAGPVHGDGAGTAGGRRNPDAGRGREGKVRAEVTIRT